MGVAVQDEYYYGQHSQIDASFLPKYLILIYTFIGTGTSTLDSHMLTECQRRRKSLFAPGTNPSPLGRCAGPAARARLPRQAGSVPALRAGPSPACLGSLGGFLQPPGFAGRLRCELRVYSFRRFIQRFLAKPLRRAEASGRRQGVVQACQDRYAKFA